MKPTLERLTEQFTQLIGPEAVAKAQAARASAEAAAAAAAKAAAEAAAAKAAAAKAAAEAAAKAATAGTSPVAPASAAPAKAGPANAVSAPPTPGAASPAPARPAAPAGSAAPSSPSAPATTPRTPAPAAGPTSVTAARPAVAAAPRPAPAPAAAPALPPLLITATDHALKGYHFDAIVAPEQVVAAAQILDREGFGLDTITGVDWIGENQMEVVYDFFHPSEYTRVVIRTRVLRTTPKVPTISEIFPGANWHERETHDFFGIEFSGHPNLKPFLLPEDADFHPLRKDYQP